MQFINGIENFNYNPIQGYNAFLKGNATFNQKVEIPNETEFDKVLTLQTAKVEPAEDTPAGLMKKIEQGLSLGLNDVNNKRLMAAAAQEEFAMGGDVSVHDLMIAQEKASLSMQMAIQTRNKMIAAYNDIKNMVL